METEKSIYTYNSIINYMITDNICQICANNGENIKKYRHALGGRTFCQHSNKNVTECHLFDNLKEFIENGNKK